MKSLITYLFVSAFCAACATTQPSPDDLQQIQKHQEAQQEKASKKGNPTQSTPQDPSSLNNPKDNTKDFESFKRTLKFDLEDGADFVLQLLLKR